MRFEKFLLIIVMTSSCERVRLINKFEWGYRVCDKSTKECLDYNALFDSKESCDRHLERDAMSCKGGKYLQALEMEQPACWKTESVSARAECNRLD
jgi:hypothetical protein